MELYIGENYRITSDPMNVMLQERKMTKPSEKNPIPTERWDTIGYHATVLQATMAFKRISEKESESETMTGFIRDLERIESRIINAVGQWKIEPISNDIAEKEDDQWRCTESA